MSASESLMWAIKLVTCNDIPGGSFPYIVSPQWDQWVLCNTVEKG